MAWKPLKQYRIGSPGKVLRVTRSFSRAGLRIRLSGPVGYAIVYFRSYARGTAKTFKTIDEGAAVTGGVVERAGYSRVAYLAHLQVNAEYQGQGYGEAIVRLVERLDPDVDVVALIANADTEELTPRLHAFYRRCGFKSWPDKPYVFLKRVGVARRATFRLKSAA